jgi:cyanophycinase-like exopeptidase
VPVYLTGAKIRSCHLAATANVNVLFLNGDTSKIMDSTLIASGSGKAINAGAAHNIVSAHNRGPIGYGANVTNLVAADGGCVWDANIG